jgi:predicted RNA-binding Zn-ribbon protein involved in translation (DUF1610 family)
MKESDRRWVQAGVILGENPRAYVPCPICAEAALEVEDVPYPDNEELFDRYLRCPNCGAQQVLVRVRSSYS